MDDDKIKSLQISGNSSLKSAINKLNETAEGILFVIDHEERLIGCVTDGDIRRGIIGGLGLEGPVKSVMKRDYSSIKNEEPNRITLARNMMLKEKIEQIPVLDRKGRLVEVVLWIDVLDAKATRKSMKTNAVVIMAGGKGTRMDPFTRILPKALIPVGEKPAIEIIMERFYRYGFNHFIYTLNHKKEYLKLFLKDISSPYDVSWVEEESFLDTAGSLALLKDKLTETFFVSNCDSLLDVDFSSVLRWHQEQEAALSIIGCYNEIRIPFGILKIKNGQLGSIHEKPVKDVIVNTGVYVMEPSVLEYIPEGSPMDMSTLIDVVKGRQKVSVYPTHGSWLDLGQWDEYQTSIRAVARDNIDE
jgi:dTDP-glucose pyrophosphorylase